MDIEKKLTELGLQLPTLPTTVVGTFILSTRVDNILFLGGTIGRLNGEPLTYSGKVGQDATIEQAYEMARHCALCHLAAMKAALGDLDRVERIVKVMAYINTAPGFADYAKVANGESDLYVQLWGERGQHTRAAIGIAGLGSNACVETEVTVQVR